MLLLRSATSQSPQTPVLTVAACVPLETGKMEATSCAFTGQGHIVRHQCPRFWQQRINCKPRMGLAQSRLLRPSAIDRSMSLAAATASQDLTRQTAQIVVSEASFLKYWTAMQAGHTTNVP